MDNAKIAFGVAVIVVGIFFFRGNLTGNAVSDGVVEITTTLQNFQYNPDTITVNKGSTVKLTIVNQDNVEHGLHLNQFGIVRGIPPYQTVTVEFIAVETATNGKEMQTCSQSHGETLTINVV